MLGHAIKAFARIPITLYRAAGSVDYGSDGRLQYSDQASMALLAVVHPASGKDIDLLPEGSKVTESIWIYCTEEIRAMTSESVADTIRFKTQLYEIKTVYDRSHDGGFYKALAVLKVT